MFKTLELNDNNVVMLEANFSNDTFSVLVTIENKELVTYSILNDSYEDTDISLSENEFIELNNYLYKQNLITENDPELILDLFYHLH